MTEQDIGHSQREQEQAIAAHAIEDHRRRVDRRAALNDLTPFEQELVAAAYRRARDDLRVAIRNVIGAAAVTVDAAHVLATLQRSHLEQRLIVRGFGANPTREDVMQNRGMRFTLNEDLVDVVEAATRAAGWRSEQGESAT
jgi:hypothetical protein